MTDDIKVIENLRMNTLSLAVMRMLFLFLVLSMPVLAIADDEKLKTCTEQAYERYPVPNYDMENRRMKDLGAGFDNNYLSDAPNTTDYARIKKKRDNFISQCMAAE